MIRLVLSEDEASVLLAKALRDAEKQECCNHENVEANICLDCSAILQPPEAS